MSQQISKKINIKMINKTNQNNVIKEVNKKYKNTRNYIKDG